MSGVDSSLKVAVFLWVTHAVGYLGLGGLGGWWLARRRAPRGGAAGIRAEVACATNIDAKRVESLLAQLYGWTTDVAHGVGEHSSQVAAVGRELSTLANDGDGKGAPVVQAIARLLQANARLEEQLAQASERMQEQAREIEVKLADALTDPLTGLANRRALNQELSRRAAEFKRMRTPLSLVMVDVDYFKRLNDTQGHQAGDAVLRGVAGVLKATVREMDLATRYGGEEFAVILPTATLQVARQIAERIRQAIAQARFGFGGRELRVTASIGAAEMLAGGDQETLVERADLALYAAKEAGRNVAYYHDGEVCRPIAKESDAAQATSTQPPVTATKIARPGLLCEVKSATLDHVRTRDEWIAELDRLARAVPPGGALSVVLLEIDSANADSSTSERLALLPRLVTTLRETATEPELIAAMGPCTLGLILPTTGAAAAVEMANLIQSRFAQHATTAGSDVETERATLSFGVSEAPQGMAWAAIVARAEEALEASKLAGGNRTHFHTSKTRRPMLADLRVLSIQ
jgi:diguanylate cyclase (GGDEF)-like protein